jgi:hypothetical protein
MMHCSKACLLRWLLRAVVVVAAAFVATYAGDWAIFKLRYLTIPLKGNKQEFDYLGSFDAPCSISLFPQAGQAACWQLRRHPNQGTTL